MNNLFRKILLTATVAFGFVFPAGSSLASPPLPAPLIVEFQTGLSIPLFNEANFVPGESVARWVRVTNNSGAGQTVVTEARNFTSPVQETDLSRVLEITITEGGATLYGPKLLSEFFADSGKSMADDEKEITLSDLANGKKTEYLFTISMLSNAGNDWQERTTGFDIAIGFKQETEDEDGVEGHISAVISGGSGGGGGGWNYYSPTLTSSQTSSPTPMVAGASTTNGGQEGIGGGLAQGGGIIGGTSTLSEPGGGETSSPSISPSPTGLATGANILSMFSDIFSLWWLLLILILIALLILIRFLLRRKNNQGIE